MKKELYRHTETKELQKNKQDITENEKLQCHLLNMHGITWPGEYGAAIMMVLAIVTNDHFGDADSSIFPPCN